MLTAMLAPQIIYQGVSRSVPQGRLRVRDVQISERIGLGVQVTPLRSCVGEGRTAGPRSTSLRAGSRLPPDFLSGFVVSIDLVRLSLLKAAYVAVG